MKNLMVVLIDHRKKNAVQVQKILSEWGCLIRTRLGIHEGVLENCSEEGLVVLDLVGDREKHERLMERLNALPGVKAKLVSISFEEEGK